VAIDEFKQAKMLHINERIRLVKVNKNRYIEALKWYHDSEIMLMSEGIDNRLYTLDDLHQMYDFLGSEGELYFIEYCEQGSWKAIGDVTLMRTNIPIVIGDRSYWGKGIGKQVLRRIIGRSIELGFEYLKVPQVYLFNERSKGLYESLGFKELARDDHVVSYYMEL